MKYTGIIITALAVFIYGCRKEIDKGTLIKAEGYVTDTVKHKRLPGAKVYLLAGHQSFYGIHYTTAVDSTLTDNDGNFSITYHAEGNSVDYALSISTTGNYFTDIGEPYIIFNFATQLNNVRLKGRELNYTKIVLNVLSNAYDTFYVSVYANYRSEILTGSSIDTILYARHLPACADLVMYYATTHKPDSGYIMRRIIDTLDADLSDTITIHKTIDDIFSMPLAP